MQRIEIWEDTNDSIGEKSRTAFHRWRPMREILESALDEEDDDDDETDGGDDDGSESIAAALALVFASGSSGSGSVRIERGFRSCSGSTKAAFELDNEEDDEEEDDPRRRLSWGTSSDGGLGGYKRTGRSELDMALALMAIEADLFSSSGSESFRDRLDSSCKERGRTTIDSQ